MNNSKVTVLASFRGYLLGTQRVVKLKQNRSWHRSVSKSDYFLLLFGQEIRYLDSFELNYPEESDEAYLKIDDDDLVQELLQVKNVGVGLLKEDYQGLTSEDCAYCGFEVYFQGELIGRVVGYSRESALAVLEIEFDGKVLLVPEVSEYIAGVGDNTLQLQNIEDLLNL